MNVLCMMTKAAYGAYNGCCLDRKRIRNECFLVIVIREK
jgi:hypothetical protein